MDNVLELLERIVVAQERQTYLMEKIIEVIKKDLPDELHQLIVSNVVRVFNGNGGSIVVDRNDGGIIIG